MERSPFLRDWMNHRAALRLRALHMTRWHWADAEDLLQETFIACWLSCGARSFSFMAWSHGVMRNLMRRKLTHQGAAKRGGGAQPVALHPTEPAMVAARAENILFAKQCCARFCLLPPRQEQVMGLVALEHELVEIDETLGLPQGNAKVHAFRARRRLRAVLA